MVNINAYPDPVPVHAYLPIGGNLAEIRAQLASKVYVWKYMRIKYSLPSLVQGRLLARAASSFSPPPWLCMQPATSSLAGQDTTLESRVDTAKLLLEKKREAFLCK